MLNARIRKRWLASPLKVGMVFGEQPDLTYEYDYLGAGPDTLGEVVSGKQGFAEILSNAERPMIIVGQGALGRADGAAILSMAAQIARACGAIGEELERLQRAAHRGLARRRPRSRPGAGGGRPRRRRACSRTARRRCCSSSAPTRSRSPAGPFVVYQGTHGDRGAHRADVILPGAAYTEKSATYVNTEGRVAARASAPSSRRATPARTGRSCARSRRCSASSCPTIRCSSCARRMYAAHPHLAELDIVAPAPADRLQRLADLGGECDKAPFASPDSRLLLYQSDCAGFRGHGRTERAGRATPSRGGDGHPWVSLPTTSFCPW